MTEQERRDHIASLRQMVEDARDDVADCEARLARCEDDLQFAQDYLQDLKDDLAAWERSDDEDEDADFAALEGRVDES